MTQRSAVEVWAQLVLSAEDCHRVRSFFARELAIDGFHLVRRMHITVYHSMVELPGVVPTTEAVREPISAAETRFMVMTGGGETALPGVRPGSKPVGIRIQRNTPGYTRVQSYRQRLLTHETPAILGNKLPSTHRRSALAASPNYQPHMVILREQSPIPDDLTVVGARWREQIGDLIFDTFLIDVSRNTSRADRADLA